MRRPRSIEAKSGAEECSERPDRSGCASGLQFAGVERDSDLTELLESWSHGDAQALERLAPLVQSRLREMARRLLAQERLAGDWQPTDLVHELYLRLLDWRVIRWQNRGQFFSTTARMMRRVLVDMARARRAAKRGLGAEPLALDTEIVVDPPVDVIAVDEALEALSQIEPRPSRVVELRFFGGFTVEETAETLGVSVRTVINDWNTARAWLCRELSRRA
jgi:RNA polymerase sigma factor (TIGR02999 family)